MKVERYTIEAACCLGMEQHVSETPDEGGAWVRHADYVALEQRYDAMWDKLVAIHADYDRVRLALGNLYEST